MRKSFTLCEAFGITPFGPRTVPESFREAPAARRGETAPFPSPWIPSAREGLSAVKLHVEITSHSQSTNS